MVEAASSGAGPRVGRGACGLTIAVASGKGGVGKTSVVVNLALALARDGLRVTVVDGDLALANLDVLLGLTPGRTLYDFLRERTPLALIAQEGPLGIQVIPAGSGLPDAGGISAEDLRAFEEALGQLRLTNDIVLLDSAAGISECAARLWTVADRILLVTWPEPAAMMDAYAVLKLLRRSTPAGGAPPPVVELLVNGAADADEAERVHERLNAAAHQFLDQGFALAGYILKDEALVDAARRQAPLVLSQPHAPASRCFERLALQVAALVHGHASDAPRETCEKRAWRAGLLH